VENTVYISNELKVPLLWIGIAGIFGGRQDRCGHWDRPKPLGVYARAKWAGGESVRINARTYPICRAGWMVGGGPSKDRKSVKKLMRQLHDGKRELNVVDDKLGTPTYTRDFAPRPDCRRLLDRQPAPKGLDLMRPWREALSDYLRGDCAGYVVQQGRTVVPQVGCTHMTRPVDRLLHSENVPRNRA